MGAEDAKAIEERVKEIAHLGVSPHYLGRDLEWLCFDYLSLREAQREESPAFWEHLGGSLALLESIPSKKVDIAFTAYRRPIEAKEFSAYIFRAAEEISKKSYLDKKEVQALKNRFAYLLSKGVSHCMGYLDLLPGNVLVDQEKSIIIDEEGFAQTIKGLSLIRPMNIWKGQPPHQELRGNVRESFLKGYALKGGDRAYYEEHEQNLGTVYYTLKAYASIVESGSSHRSVAWLKNLL